MCFAVVVKLTHFSECSDIDMWLLAARKVVALVMTCFDLRQAPGGAA